MTLDERVKALETKLSGTGWRIEGCGASENYSPIPMALLLKRIEVLEKTIEDLKEAASIQTAGEVTTTYEINLGINRQ